MIRELGFIKSKAIIIHANALCMVSGSEHNRIGPLKYQLEKHVFESNKDIDYLSF